MTKRLAATLLLAGPVLGLCIALGGCSAAAGLLLIDKWEDWFDDEDPADYNVLLDGYDIGTTASASGLISVTGALERDYLVSVARPPEMRKGVHAVVHVTPGRAVNLKNTNPFDGAVITGTVRRDSSSGAYVPDARVIAIKNGAQTLAASPTPISIPPGSGTEYMIGYTDDSGAFRLGPASYGSWLVVVTMAGYTADAKHVQVLSGQDATAALVIVEDSGVTTGMVAGAVAAFGGLPLGTPLVTADLDDPYVPEVSAATRNQVQSSSGLTLPSGAWFRFNTLTTLGSGAGLYQLRLPAGNHEVEAYKRPWNAVVEDVTITNGGIATQNFALRK